MQTPPRKGKLTAALRSVHNEQLTKLQTKHQQELHLLEDFTNFAKQRAAIEKNYGEALLKLSTSLLQKKIPSITDAKTDDGKQRKSVYTVWRMVLDENEKLAKARLAAAEVFQQQIFESAKNVKTQKAQVTKKCLDHMQRLHDEIQLAVRELDKAKKLYTDEEHVAHEARDKAHEADEKLKRKKGHFFQSLSSLQKNSAKFSSKKEACDVRSTAARNEYLLCLAAANAHQTRYHEMDLPEIMKMMDAEVYEKVAEYFQLLSQTELFTCAATHSSFSNVKEVADLITRQHNVQCYLQDWTVLRDKIVYKFEPCDNDTIDYISAENSAGPNLNKEAKKCATRIAKENKSMRDYHKQLRILLNQCASANKDEAGGPDQQAAQDLELKIEELRQNIRKSETGKLKAEARIEMLRQAGVNVEEWLKTDYEALGPFDSGSGLSRAGSTLSVKTDISGNIDNGSSEFYDSDYNDDISDTSPGHGKTYVEPTTEFDDRGSLHRSSVTSTGDKDADTTSLVFTPIRCVALYSYMAQNGDELSIMEQEVLEIVGEGDGDGWVKARNSQGVEGFVPQNYVEIESGEAIPSSIHPAPTSFSSVDYSMPQWDDEGGVQDIQPTDGMGIEDVLPPPPPSVLDGSEPANPPSSVPIIIQNHVNEDRAVLCRAVYDYEATCPEELTLVEGQVIRVLQKDVHDVDDGWWEGEVDGQVGLFPSLVVEELKSGGEPRSPQDDLSSPPGSAPPTFAPPPMPQFLSAAAQVIITQPTPETEMPDSDEESEKTASVAYSYQNPDFEMELSDTQQSQYHTQFGGETDANANETQDSPSSTAQPDIFPESSNSEVEVNEVELNSHDDPEILAHAGVEALDDDKHPLPFELINEEAIPVRDGMTGDEEQFAPAETGNIDEIPPPTEFDTSGVTAPEMESVLAAGSASEVEPTESNGNTEMTIASEDDSSGNLVEPPPTDIQSAEMEEHTG